MISSHKASPSPKKLEQFLKESRAFPQVCVGVKTTINDFKGKLIFSSYIYCNISPCTYVVNDVYLDEIDALSIWYEDEDELGCWMMRMIMSRKTSCGGFVVGCDGG